MECTFASRRLELKEPLETSYGVISEREIVEVTLRDHDGATGRGEAAPLEPYDGVPLAAVAAALDVYATILEDAEIGATHDELLERCAAERDLPQALAAIDLALWDMAGIRAGEPVAQLLAERPGGPGSALKTIPLNALLSATDRTGAAAQATAAVDAGYATIKLKVGIGDDAGRLAAVRAAVGPHVNLRIDANGAWATAREALANLRALEPMGIELCEEPVHGVEALAELKPHSPVPIAMDETDEPGSGATHAVCLKITRGGISQVLADAAAARGAGSTVYLAHTFDGPLGLAAALHAAAVIRPDHPCGLPTGEVPAGPGLLGDSQSG